MAFIASQLLVNPNRRIDIVGHSRGGYVAMEVARDLMMEGINGESVDVRFLGLYDPVDMPAGYGDAETVSANVKIGSSDLRCGDFSRAGHSRWKWPSSIYTGVEPRIWQG